MVDCNTERIGWNLLQQVRTTPRVSSHTLYEVIWTLASIDVNVTDVRRTNGIQSR